LNITRIKVSKREIIKWVPSKRKLDLWGKNTLTSIILRRPSHTGRENFGTPAHLYIEGLIAHEIGRALSYALARDRRGDFFYPQPDIHSHGELYPALEGACLQMGSFQSTVVVSRSAMLRLGSTCYIYLAYGCLLLVLPLKLC
jgi:hypothetical protein